MPKTFFAETNFKYKDNYHLTLNQYQLDWSPEGGIIDSFKELLNDANVKNLLLEEDITKLTEGFQKIYKFTHYYSTQEKNMSPKYEEVREFRTIYGDTKNKMEEIVENLRLLGRTKSEARLFDYLTAVQKYMAQNEPTLDSLTKGLLRTEKYEKDFLSGEEEKMEKKQLEKLGLVGHQPTIDECLNMDPEKMDMDLLADRMLWLSHHSSTSTKSGRNSMEDNVYTYTFQKVAALIAGMPLDKQVEYCIRIHRQQHALWAAADEKYKKLLSEIPEDCVYEDKEHLHLVYEEMVQMPQYQETVATVRAELKESAETRRNFLLRQARASDIECKSEINNLTLEIDRLSNTKKATEDIKNRIDKMRRQIEQLETQLVKNKNAEANAASIAEHEIEDRLMAIFRENPEFKKILSRYSREHRAMLELSNTQEYWAADSCQDLVRSTIGDSDRIQRLYSNLVRSPEAADKLNNIPGYNVGAKYVLGEINEMMKQFRDSSLKDCKDLHSKIVKTEKEDAKDIMNRWHTNLSNAQEDMAESYFLIANDNQKASKQFTALKKSLKSVFSVLPEASQDVEGMTKLYKSVLDAQEKIAAYIDRHNHLLIVSRGNRVELARGLSSNMKYLRTVLSNKIRQAQLKESAETLRAILNNMQNENPDLRPSNPENELKEAYGRVLFCNFKHHRPNDLVSGAEETEFRKFINSKSFLAAFQRLNPRMLRHLAEDPITLDKIKKEHKVIRENQYLDSIPDNLGKIALDMKHVDMAKHDKTRYFDNFDPTGKKIDELSGQDGRLGLDGEHNAYIMLAIGEMLENGKNLDQIFDPFALDTERREAGRNVLKAFETKNDDEYAKFCAERLLNVLDSGMNHISEKMQAMGEFTVEKLSRPEFKNIIASVEVLRNALQELSKPSMTDAMKTLEAENPGKYANFEALEKNASAMVNIMEPVTTGTKQLFNQAAIFHHKNKITPERETVNKDLKEILTTRHTERMIRSMLNKLKNKNFRQIVEEKGGYAAKRIGEDNQEIMKMDTSAVEPLLTQPGVLSYTARSILQDKASKAADVALSSYQIVDPLTHKMKRVYDSAEINKDMIATIKKSVNSALIYAGGIDFILKNNSKIYEPENPTNDRQRQM